MALARCDISEGPRPGFKAIGIPSVQGHREFLTIEERFLVRQNGDYLLPVEVVGTDRRQGTALVELPLEADSGANRVWVRLGDLIPEPDEALS